MKRTFSFITMTLLFLTGAIKTWAVSYDDPNLQTDVSSVFYIDILDADGNSISSNYVDPTAARYDIGAYVNGELRGIGKASNLSDTKAVFTVRVWGGSDLGTEDVEFRMYSGSLEYTIGTQENVDLSAANTFGEPGTPLTFTFNPITGVSVTPSEINIEVGESAEFQVALLPAEHSTPVNESEITYSFTGETANTVLPFSIDADNRTITGTQAGEGKLVAIAFLGQYSNGVRSTANVTVTEPVVPVTGITAPENVETNVTLWVNDHYQPRYSILPADATNQSVTFAVGDNTVIQLDANNGVTAKKKGTSTLTITTEDGNFTLTYNFTVKQPVTSISYIGDNPLIIPRDTKVTISKAMFDYKPDDADFEESNIRLSSNSSEISENISGLWVLKDDGSQSTPNDEITGNTIIGFTPYPNYTLYYEYNGVISSSSDPITVCVQDKIELGQGWNWIGLGYGVSVASTLYNAIGENFIEARSQNALMYNDPVYSLFGDLNTITSGEGYKVKTSAATDALLTLPTMSNNGTWYTETIITGVNNGWNWLASPFVRDVKLSEIISEANDGDIVKTLDGVAEWSNTGGGWSTNLTIAEHEGFLYKTTLSQSIRYSWKPTSCTEADDYTSNIISGSNSPSGIKAKKFWKYDVGAFPSNMGIIAAADALTDGERFTIGAFVGDECRGQGRLEKGKWFIVVHGKGGEQVSLQLYDHLTGAYSPLTMDGQQTIRFSEMAGSLNAPIVLGSNVVTGIEGLSCDNEEGKAGVAYDLSGRRIEAKNLPKGIYIIGGKKVAVK